MIKFKAAIEDKKNYIGWIHIIVPAKIAVKLHDTDKKSFKVKGKLDDHAFSGINLLPAGGGDYFMAINATLRKAIRKKQGDTIIVTLEKDSTDYAVPADIMECLHDEPAALAFFESLPRGHRNYFCKWVDTAKTTSTRSNRIAIMVTALAKRMDFGTMLREQRDSNQ